MEKDGEKKTRSKLGSKRQLPSGRWFVRVSAGKRRDGSRRVLSKTVDTEREADICIAEFASQLARVPAAGDPMKLLDYYELFFVPTRKMRGLANSTLISYEYVFRKYIEPVFGDREMDAIDGREVQSMLHLMPADAAKRFVRVLRTVLRAAWEDGLLAEKPLDRTFHYPKAAQKESRVWSASALSRALSVLRGRPLEGITLLMAGAGLRREEAYPLRFSEISFEETNDGTLAVFEVNRAETLQDGVKDTKTEFSQRLVVVGEPFSSRLRELAKEDASVPHGKHPGDPDRAGRVCPISLHRVGRSWKEMWEEKVPSKHDDPARACAKGAMLAAGVPYIPMSRLRATHETLLQASGVEDTLNARIHGRSSASDVGYTHYLVPQEEGKAKAATALAEKLGAGKPQCVEEPPVPDDNVSVTATGGAMFTWA